MSHQGLLWNGHHVMTAVLDLTQVNFKARFKTYVFSVLSVTVPEPLMMMSSSANYRPFLSSFRHIPPQESFVKLANRLYSYSRY